MCITSRESGRETLDAVDCWWRWALIPVYSEKEREARFESSNKNRNSLIPRVPIYLVVLFACWAREIRNESYTHTKLSFRTHVWTDELQERMRVDCRVCRLVIVIVVSRNSGRSIAMTRVREKEVQFLFGNIRKINKYYTLISIALILFLKNRNEEKKI